MDVITPREFATYQHETVRTLLERQSGVFALVLCLALALDVVRLHPSAELATILQRLPIQIAICVLVFGILRGTRLGARFPTEVGTFAYVSLAGFGGLLLGDLGGLDGPFFYSAYVLPTFVMILPVTFRQRVVMTSATVLAFGAAFFLPHPEHLTHRYAHIAFAYLAAITAVNLHFGHRVMLLLRDRFTMARALERHEARIELARDLHDEMGQLVVGTRLELHQLERALAAGTSLSAESLGYLHGLVDRLDRQVRDKVRSLRDGETTGRFDEALAVLVASYARTDETRITLDVALDDEPSPALREVMLQVTREALTNALKHASPRRIDVRVRTHAGQLLLEVEDDGVGHRESAPPGFGLLGMRERVARVGGEFGIERVGTGSGDARPGTRVWARFEASRGAEDTSA